MAITSLENRLLVSCSCLDSPLSIYLALSFSLSLSHSLSDSRCSVGSQRSLSDIPVAHFVPVWRMHKAAMYTVVGFGSLCAQLTGLKPSAGRTRREP